MPTSPFPHIPACCPRCYALLDERGRAIADIVRRVITRDATRSNRGYYQPKRVPLCERNHQSEGCET